jgi:hypothetical protein
MIFRHQNRYLYYNSPLLISHGKGRHAIFLDPNRPTIKLSRG